MEKPAKTSSHKTVLVIVALLLAGGATGAYFYRQRSEPNKPAANQTTTPTDSPKESKKAVATRYEETKEQLKDTSTLTNTQKATLYASAAFDGAVLDDPAAKGYASQALALYPDDKAFQEANKAYASFAKILTDISKGKYDSAKASSQVE